MRRWGQGINMGQHKTRNWWIWVGYASLYRAMNITRLPGSIGMMKTVMVGIFVFVFSLRGVFGETKRIKRYANDDPIWAVKIIALHSSLWKNPDPIRCLFLVPVIPCYLENLVAFPMLFLNRHRWKDSQVFQCIGFLEALLQDVRNCVGMVVSWQCLSTKDDHTNDHTHNWWCVLFDELKMFPLFRGTEQDISISNFPCKMGVHYFFRGVECLMRMDHVFLMSLFIPSLVSFGVVLRIYIPWIFVDWYYSLPALVKNTDQKSPSKWLSYLYDRLQNHQVVTECFGCHILWLLARSNCTCRQRRCGRKRCWIDYPCPETVEQLNICSWWCMVPGTWYCIV